MESSHNSGETRRSQHLFTVSLRIITSINGEVMWTCTMTITPSRHTDRSQRPLHTHLPLNTLTTHFIGEHMSTFPKQVHTDLCDWSADER